MRTLVRLVATRQDAPDFAITFATTLKRKRVNFTQGLTTPLFAPSLLFCAIRALVRDME
jgi:hypothetical protein